MKRFAAGMFLCLAATVCQQNPSTVRVERTVFLMGTFATFIAESDDRQTGLDRLDRMVQVVENTEEELSTWRHDSVLSTLNRQPVETWLSLTNDTCGLLDQVATWHRVTEGAFDPAVGRLIDVWALRGDGRWPDSETLAEAQALSGFHHVVVDSRRCLASRFADVTVDAGGFGKGAALDRVRIAEDGQPGAWLIDFGGQVAVSSVSAEGGWPVAVAHPEFRDVPVAELHLIEGSIATTGGSERDVFIDTDTRIGHVIDPRTGMTVSRSSSVTVWHEDALAADILSTALYVMGWDVGLEWAEKRNVAACFVIPSDGVSSSDAAVQLRPTRAFQRRFILP